MHPPGTRLPWAPSPSRRRRCHEAFDRLHRRIQAAGRHRSRRPGWTLRRRGPALARSEVVADPRYRTGEPMTAADGAIMLAAAVTGGLMNAMAGGGTIVTFPVLVFLGEPAIIANATSTVALLPGAAASMAGYGKEVASHQEWLKTLLLPSVVGGGIGSVLLLRTPEHTFANLAPLLVLFATLLFIWQGILARRRARRIPAGSAGLAASAEYAVAAAPAPAALPGSPPAATGADRRLVTSDAAGGAADDPPSLRLSRGRWVTAILFQFAISIYGGYFGAAIGILMLAVLGFLGLTNIFAMNGLKNFFGFCINGVAAAYFILRGAVVWPVALLMMAGSIAGGYRGRRLAQGIRKEKGRGAGVGIGFVVAATLFWQRVRS